MQWDFENYEGRRQACLEEEDTIGIQDHIRARLSSRDNNRAQMNHTSFVPMQTKSWGTTFRVANGNTRPNLGEEKLDKTASNGDPIKIKTQVAHVTKRLVATSEMVGAVNFVVIHKQAGTIKHPSKESHGTFLEILRAEKGQRCKSSESALPS